MFLKKQNLKNKIALVTGAGKGIGKACAIALAEAGASLIIVSRTKKDLDQVSKIVKKFRSKCKSYVCDVTRYSEIKSVIDSQKRIDILVNNAGTNIPEHFTKVKRNLKTTAAPIPQKINFFLCSIGNWEATIPIIIALSPAKTRSIKMICVKIVICSGVIKSESINF